MTVFELLAGFRHQLVLFSNLKQNIGVSEKFSYISAPKETSFCPFNKRKVFAVSLVCLWRLSLAHFTPNTSLSLVHERENLGDPGKRHNSLLLMGIRYQHISWLPKAATFVSLRVQRAFEPAGADTRTTILTSGFQQVAGFRRRSVIAFSILEKSIEVNDLFRFPRKRGFPTQQKEGPVFQWLSHLWVKASSLLNWKIPWLLIGKEIRLLANTVNNKTRQHIISSCADSRCGLKNN